MAGRTIIHKRIHEKDHSTAHTCFVQQSIVGRALQGSCAKARQWSSSSNGRISGSQSSMHGTRNYESVWWIACHVQCGKFSSDDGSAEIVTSLFRLITRCGHSKIGTVSQSQRSV